MLVQTFTSALAVFVVRRKQSMLCPTRPIFREFAAVAKAQAARLVGDLGDVEHVVDDELLGQLIYHYTDLPGPDHMPDDSVAGQFEGSRIARKPLEQSGRYA